MVEFVYGYGPALYTEAERVVMERDLAAVRAGQVSDLRGCHALTQHAVGFGIGTVVALNRMTGNVPDTVAVEIVMHRENDLPLSILLALAGDSREAYSDRVKHLAESYVPEVLELWEVQRPAGDPVRYGTIGPGATARA